jgi:hypothetical protein
MNSKYNLEAALSVQIDTEIRKEQFLSAVIKAGQELGGELFLQESVVF